MVVRQRHWLDNVVRRLTSPICPLAPASGTRGNGQGKCAWCPCVADRGGAPLSRATAQLGLLGKASASLPSIDGVDGMTDDSLNDGSFLCPHVAAPSTRRQYPLHGRRTGGMGPRTKNGWGKRSLRHRAIGAAILGALAGAGAVAFIFVAAIGLTQAGVSLGADRSTTQAATDLGAFPWMVGLFVTAVTFLKELVD